MFQSAPRAPARGDFDPKMFGHDLFKFQSAPRAPARGDVPLFSAKLCPALFQSAPRAPARGDQLLFEYPRRYIVVSIRAPRTRAGRLYNPGTIYAMYDVSIRAPRTRAGRHENKNRTPDTVSVSIRAPRTRAGRHFAVHGDEIYESFQSAPRAPARGDFPEPCQRRDFVFRFNPRPAHPRGATAVLPTSSTAKL